MTAVKLSGVLPDGDANGLDKIARDVLDDPNALHIVVAVLTTSKITHDVSSGESQPTMRLVRIESVDTRDGQDGLRLLKRGYSRRTGQEMLPIELEAELDEAIANVDRDGPLL